MFFSVSSLEKLPLSFLILFQFAWVVLGDASLTPPTSLGTATSTSSGTASSTTSNSSITGSVSGSNSASLSGSSTSTASLPSLSGYSSCVSNCFLLAVTDSNCTNVVPESCYCTSSNFTSSLISCMHDQCPTELSTAESLANRFCALASTSTSLSFSVTSFPSTSSTLSSSSLTTTNTSPSTGSSSGTSSASATSNAAAGVPLGNINHATVLGLSVAFIGVVFGAFVIG